MKHLIHKMTATTLALIAGAIVSGCAKEECYECTPAAGSPYTETVSLCEKGQQLDVSLAYYRSSGYHCAKTSGSANITGPENGAAPVSASESNPGVAGVETSGCE